LAHHSIHSKVAAPEALVQNIWPAGILAQGLNDATDKPRTSRVALGSPGYLELYIVEIFGTYSSLAEWCSVLSKNHSKRYNRLTMLRTGAVLFAVATGALFGQSSGIDLKAMDTGVQACDNFYQYACGTWRKNNPVPGDKARWGRFNELAEQNLAIERTILEKASQASSRSPAEQKIGDLYNSCMDEKGNDAKGVTPIEPVLARIRNAASKEDLLREVAALHGQSIRVLFSFGVRADAKNSSEQIASADQGGLTLPDREYYLKTDTKSAEIRKQFAEHVRKMFALAGKPGIANPDAAVMEVETALAKVSLDRVARRNPTKTYHRMPVGELAKLTPQFDWNDYLAHVGVPKIASLNVGAPEFFKGMNEVVAKTGLEALKTYFA